MNKLHFSIFINAPREKVWDVMLADVTYRDWTSVFHPGSYYQGNWDKGSKMLFLGPEENGQSESGMLAEIAENRLHEFISIKHLGMIENGIEKPWGEETEGYENYTFVEKDGGTELLIDLSGIPNEYKEMFDDLWPKALMKLKEIVEK